MKLFSNILLTVTLMTGLLVANPAHTFSLESLPVESNSNRYFNDKNGVEPIFGFERIEIDLLLEQCRIDKLDTANSI